MSTKQAGKTLAKLVTAMERYEQLVAGQEPVEYGELAKVLNEATALLPECRQAVEVLTKRFP